MIPLRDDERRVALDLIPLEHAPHDRQKERSHEALRLYRALERLPQVGIHGMLLDHVPSDFWCDLIYDEELDKEKRDQRTPAIVPKRGIICVLADRAALRHE